MDKESYEKLMEKIYEIESLTNRAKSILSDVRYEIKEVLAVKCGDIIFVDQGQNLNGNRIYFRSQVGK